MKKFFYFSIILLILSSCTTESSDDVAESAIYQAYFLLYDKSDNKTLACAQFRDGGPLGNDVILNSPASISINGDILVHQNIGYWLYYHYYKEFTDKVNLGTFVFTDKNSKTYTNNADLSTLPEIGFPSGLDNISKSNDFVFTWTGASLAQGETIELEINSADTSFYYNSSTLGAVSIVVPKANLAAFQLGDVNLELNRYRIDGLQASTGKGGEIRLEYHTEQEGVIVE